MIPFQPKTLLEHQQRYAAALEEPLDEESMRLGVAPLPGELCANVFDFADGLRIVVSRIRPVEGGLRLFMSATVWPGTPMFRAIEAGRLLSPAFRRIALERHRLVSCSEDELTLIGFCETNNVPCWYRELSE